MSKFFRDEIAKAHLQRGQSIRSVAKECGISRHAAARLRDQFPDGWKTWMLAFDFHGEHADPKMLNLFEHVQQDLVPDYVVLGGDIANCDWASKKFGKESPTAAEEEADMVNGWLERFGVTHYILGNHEERTMRLNGDIDPRLRSLTNIPDLLNLDQRGILWYPYDSDEEAARLHIGKLTVIHGWWYNIHVASCHAKALGCVMHGHAHRCQTFSDKAGGRKVTGISVGCMCPTTLPFERGKPPRGHMQAFAIVWEHPDGHFDFHVVRVVGPEVVVNGRVYKVGK